MDSSRLLEQREFNLRQQEIGLRERQVSIVEKQIECALTIKGEKGEVGDPGAQGAIGPKGDEGLPGQRGVRGEGGPKGAQGPKGDEGNQGEKGEPGERGINWRGDYRMGVTYAPLDAVAYIGSSWIATQQTRALPGLGVSGWDLIAKKGDDGRSAFGGGGSGESGDGTQGPPGSDGAPGAQGPPGDAADVAAVTHAAATKTTPVDADELPLVDSAASWALKNLTWANLKATLKSYFDTLYPSGSGTSSGTNTGDNTNFAAPLGADDNYVTDAQLVVIGNTSGANTGDASGHSTLVVGPASATDNAVAKFDGTTGKLLKDGVVLGTLATQSGTFSGTSSGTNTGDQTNISGNAATVTTNANLTGPITSTGNATVVAAQTGTGSTFVMQASPTLTTPNIGAAVATSLLVEQAGGNQIIARYNSSNPRAGLYTGGTSGRTFIGSNLVHSTGNVFNYDTTGTMWYWGNPTGNASVTLGIASGTAGASAGVDSLANAVLTATALGQLIVGGITGAALFQVQMGTNSESMTLGAVQTGLAVASNGGQYGLFMGIGSSGNGWIQQGRTDSATAYNLSLQASGGNVGIATSAPDKALEVNLGTASAFRLTYNDANGGATTYMDTTLSSAGVTTFTGAGSAPAFSFAQAVTFAARADLKSYTVATLPAAGAAGGIVYASDAAVAPCLAFSNGTVWKRCDNAATTVV